MKRLVLLVVVALGMSATSFAGENAVKIFSLIDIKYDLSTLLTIYIKTNRNIKLSKC